MYEYRAQCVKVVDGDTFDFDVDLGFKIHYTMRVRLKDIDTAEKNSKLAAEREHARQATEICVGLLLGAGDGETVTLRTEKDRLGIYGRRFFSSPFCSHAGVNTATPGVTGGPPVRRCISLRIRRSGHSAASACWLQNCSDDALSLQPGSPGSCGLHGPP
jgi:hypothetical protein